MILKVMQRLYQITSAHCGAPLSEEANGIAILDSSCVLFSTHKADIQLCSLSWLPPSRPPKHSHGENILIPENHFHGSASVRKHKGRHRRPALARKLRYSGRRRGARVQVRDSCTTAPVSSSWMFWGLDLTFHANSPERAPHPVHFPGGADSIFQLSPSGGRERKHTSHFSKEGRRGGGVGGWRGVGRGQKGAELHPSRPPPCPKRRFRRRRGGGQETLSL